MRSPARWAVVVFALSCAGGGDTGNGGVGPRRTYSTAQAAAMCDAAYDQARSCGLLSEGTTQCPDSEDFDAEAACALQCIAGASCTTLEDATCQRAMGVSLAESDGAIGACIRGCVPSFACRSGESIDVDWQCDGEPDCQDGSDEVECEALVCAEAERCDGFADCMDGSDEADCPRFACSRGDSVPGSYRCDNAPDCADGSDELDCPPCPAYVGEDERCDGFMDCSDGSDEAVCAMFSCGDGEQIPEHWHCDSGEDCVDGTDELGCPRVAVLLCNGVPIEPRADVPPVPPPVLPMSMP